LGQPPPGGNQTKDEFFAQKTAPVRCATRLKGRSTGQRGWFSPLGGRVAGEKGVLADNQEVKGGGRGQFAVKNTRTSTETTPVSHWGQPPHHWGQPPPHEGQPPATEGQPPP
jgi:hypothetical protein